MINEQVVVREAGREAIAEFLRSRTCFELIRASGKVVVFETNIPIQLAFYALLEHEMMAAPLWDSRRREFAGLMTITDFVDVLRWYHDNHGRNGSAIEGLAARSLSQVLEDEGAGVLFTHATEARRGEERQEPQQQQQQQQQQQRMEDEEGPRAAANEQGQTAADYGALVAVDANASLYEACETMRRRNRRFLPVVAPEECGVLAVVTHVDVLDFFVAHFREERRLFDQPIVDLGIGTFDDVVTVAHDTRLRDVLDLLARRDLSSVPVLDDHGRVTGLYSRADITFLATATDADSVVANLATTVGELLRQRRNDEPLHTCSPHASLEFVFQLFAEVKFRRLLFLDDDNRPVGVVSARDLLAYFIDA